MIRAAIYARVSHAGGDQNPETQLVALRAFAAAREWAIVGEFVDLAPALTGQSRADGGQFAGLPEWSRLMAACRARPRSIDLILVWKLDRAFRSAVNALTRLQSLRELGVGFVCATQPIDTSSAVGRLVFTVLAAVAEMERELISERTRAGHARARAEGRHIGRPAGAKDRKPRKIRRRPDDMRDPRGPLDELEGVGA